MSRPESFSMDAELAGRLAARAQQLQLSPQALACRYVEEGLRQDDHPRVRFASGPAGRRAAISGTGLDVWEIVATIRDNSGDVAEAASYLSVPVDVVEAAVAYYGEFGEEIDALITGNQRLAGHRS